MNEIIEIEFKGFVREFFLNPEQYPFKKGDFAVVQADKGEDVGKVHHFKDCNNSKDTKKLKEILRKASSEELKKLSNNRIKEIETLKKCRELSIKHNLVMKIIDAEYQFDYNKLTFYFTADGRVDFRELVKNLASIYKTRIELRQIGARDEAKRTGGCGVCGISKCCTTCITEFSPITTQLAKEQHLTLNPLKLSGVCGKLKCCLLFEKEFYQEAKAKFPAIETVIKTSKGIGKVEKIDIFNESIFVRYEDETTEKMSLIDALGQIKK